jgi:hypothetical protein
MSILDEISDLENACDDIIIEKAIHKFLKDNYTFSDGYTIKGSVVDCDGSVLISNTEAEKLTNGLFRFGIVKGMFYCPNCPQLTSLEGAPKKVRSFYCDGCNSLTSLEGAPKEVDEAFCCSRCNKLTSLKGAPKKVRSFYCAHCKSLKTLKGAPKEVEDEFDCSCCSGLKSFKGLPLVIHNLCCLRCNSIINFKGMPNSITGQLWLTIGPKLESYGHLPKEINNLYFEIHEHVKNQSQFDDYVTKFKKYANISGRVSYDIRRW